ncbi:hypothetical protein ACI2I3_06900 [Psychrobacter namhaensis]|uniref:Uncharacterized protein n=1 Tax=Psychrobacter namhaensis TaxID=292734 RepID=A0ABW8L824_9GAMM|nr:MULTISPECIES: hypothetical protein [unclassified Psychrobacter]
MVKAKVSNNDFTRLSSQGIMSATSQPSPDSRAFIRSPLSAFIRASIIRCA